MAFTTRLRPELARALSDAAKSRGMRRADLIEAVLREWVLLDQGQAGIPYASNVVDFHRKQESG